MTSTKDGCDPNLKERLRWIFGQRVGYGDDPVRLAAISRKVNHIWAWNAVSLLALVTITFVTSDIQMHLVASIILGSLSVRDTTALLVQHPKLCSAIPCLISPMVLSHFLAYNVVIAWR